MSKKKQNDSQNPQKIFWISGAVHLVLFLIPLILMQCEGGSGSSATAPAPPEEMQVSENVPETPDSPISEKIPELEVPDTGLTLVDIRYKKISTKSIEKKPPEVTKPKEPVEEKKPVEKKPPEEVKPKLPVIVTQTVKKPPTQKPKEPTFKPFTPGTQATTANTAANTANATKVAPSKTSSLNLNNGGSGNSAGINASGMSALNGWKSGLEKQIARNINKSVSIRVALIYKNGRIQTRIQPTDLSDLSPIFRDNVEAAIKHRVRQLSAKKYIDIMEQSGNRRLDLSFTVNPL